MIIYIKHQVDSIDYQKSNQYNVFYRSVKHYKATIDISKCSLIIKFKNKESSIEWLDKYMLEFVEFQTYMIKSYGMSHMGVTRNET